MNVSHSLEERTTESPHWGLAQRVVTSAQLRSSPKLCEFFLYVVDCCLRDAPEEATEQQIGIHVFHREPGYNSSDDSIVRSQARLLRLKLAAYFADEGEREDYLIEIPKGHYLPVFHPARREVESQPAEMSAPSVPEDRGQDQEQAALLQKTSTVPAILPGIVVSVRCGDIWRLRLPAWLWQSRSGLDGGRTSPSVRGSGVELFWKPFLSGQPPLVIFSNPVFTGTPYLGMRLASSAPQAPAGAASEVVDDTYTGTGEASAIHDLTRLFDAHHAEFILKRSRLVNMGRGQIAQPHLYWSTQPERRTARPQNQLRLYDRSRRRPSGVRRESSSALNRAGEVQARVFER